MISLAPWTLTFGYCYNCLGAVFHYVVTLALQYLHWVRVPALGPVPTVRIHVAHAHSLHQLLHSCVHHQAAQGPAACQPGRRPHDRFGLKRLHQWPHRWQRWHRCQQKGGLSWQLCRVLTQWAHKRLLNVYITFMIAFRIGLQCPFIECLVLVKTFS